MSKKVYLVAAVGLLATAVACSEKSSSPAAPSSTTPTVDGAGAAADGSTLKVPAPTQTSPANGSNIDQFETTLKVNPVTALFTNTSQFAYKFQLLVNGTVVREFRTSFFTEWKATDLDTNVTYGWRVRAELATSFGPWSPTWTFKTPDVPEGYIAGGEVYDPLWTGKSVGNINGAVEFINGTGAKMVGHGSHIEYALGSTVADGELSMMVTNTPTNTEGDKTKVMSMREGRSDITTNDRRFTAEKRGNPAGIIAWRMITHRDQIDTVGRERIVVEFSASKWYLWTARWGGNRFNLTIRENNASGKVIYNFGKSYAGEYDPNPHMAYVGAPVGRGGHSDATIPGMIAKQVWLSSRDRPDFANK